MCRKSCQNTILYYGNIVEETMDSGSIIILGATPTSEALIATLNRYGHQLTLVDPDEPLLLKTSARYDISTICEHPSYPNTLALAETDKADALIDINGREYIFYKLCLILIVQTSYLSFFELNYFSS